MRDNGLPLDLLTLATAQHGLLTTRQAAQFGLCDRTLSDLVRWGILVHLNRGLYAVRQLVPDDALGRHRQLARGALMLYPDAALIGVSAAVAHGLPTFRADLARVQLARPMMRSISTKAFHLRPGLVEGDLCDLGPASSVADTIVQLALDVGTVPAICAGDAALHQGDLTIEELTEAVACVGGWPRSARARAMLCQVDGLSESVGETRLRVGLRAHGFDLVLQEPIHDEHGRFVARPDLRVRDTWVLIEFDGAVKYAEGGVDALVREKRREDKLRALGYIVVRVTWAELDDLRMVVRGIQRAMTAARRSAAS